MQRLLIVSCSQRKRPDTELLPALQRYDGPAFRVLRRYSRTRPADLPDVYVLSARFGLIASDHLIPTYDQRMTPPRACELQPQVLDALRGILGALHYRETYLAVGSDYLAALDGFEALVPADRAVTVARGSQGKRLADLHDWLYGSAPVLRERAQRQPGTEPSAATIRGVRITLTANAALVAARAALLHAGDTARRFQSWYVPLDGQRVAPKWLVSQLTGLPVHTFTTGEALRALAQIGIPVYRVHHGEDGGSVL